SDKRLQRKYDLSRVVVSSVTYSSRVPLGRMCTTWRHCYGPYNHPHTRHACPCGRL
ncbi:hypothetical protein L9F63_023677, partial [Diploptera punctata]